MMGESGLTDYFDPGVALCLTIEPSSLAWLWSVGQLRFHELALKRERLLRIFRLDQLLGEIERCVQVLLRIGEHVSADRLGAGLRRGRRVSGRASGALGDRQETFEGLAGLLDAAFSEIT